MKKLIATVIILVCVVSPRAYSQNEAQKTTKDSCRMAMNKSIAIADSVLRHQKWFSNYDHRKIKTLKEFILYVSKLRNKKDVTYLGDGSSKDALYATILHTNEKETNIYFQIVLHYKEYSLNLHGEVLISENAEMKTHYHLRIVELDKQQPVDYLTTEDVIINGDATTLSRFLE